jgi:hypothetical protein
VQMYQRVGAILITIVVQGSVLQAAHQVVLRRGISLASKPVVKLRQPALSILNKSARPQLQLFTRSGSSSTRPPKIILAAPAPSPINPFLACADNDFFDGGHTMEQHIAITDAQLQERLLRGAPISAATKFTDYPTAVTAVRDSLLANADSIVQWLGNTFSEMKCYYRHEQPIGYGFRAGSSCLPHIKYLYHSCVVLQKQARSFFILTAYPLALKV